MARPSTRANSSTQANNPIPIPPNPVPLNHILESVVKFDGSTPGVDWLRGFVDVCTYFNLDTFWRLKLIDRVLIANAADWWKSRRTQYNNDTLTPDNCIERYNLFQTEFLRYFSTEELKEQAKRDIAKIFFKPGDNPRDYVNKKTALFPIIDRRMNEKKKLRHLFAGLPPKFYSHMLSAMDSDSTPEDFVDKLKFVQEFCDKQSTSVPQVTTTTLSDFYATNALQTPRPQSSTSLTSTPQPSTSTSVTTVTSAPPSTFARPTHRDRTCIYCGKTGHNIYSCFKHCDDFNIPRPIRNTRPRDQNPTNERSENRQT